MRRSLLLVLGGTLLASCASADPTGRARWPGTPTTPVIAADAFVPLVEEPGGFGACREPASPHHFVGYRNVGFAYPGPPDRHIGISLDRQGEVDTYADLRGASSADAAGDVTNVAINFRSGRAWVINVTANGDVEKAEVPFDEALDSENLGNPQAVIALVLDTCA